jgi:four helix bundle protein
VGVKHYQDLQAWQKAMELAEICYNITRSFPKEEMFGMTSQIRRSATSVPSNIAEGYGRGNDREFNNFLRIARGSLSELETQLLLSQRVGLISASQGDSVMVVLNELGRVLRGLQKAVREGIG